MMARDQRPLVVPFKFGLVLIRTRSEFVAGPQGFPPGSFDRLTE